MRTWHTATHDLRCGGPHGDWVTIPAGAPVQVITGFGRPKYRCVACATTTPPAAARPRAESPATGAGFTSFRGALGDVLDVGLMREDG
jgi:hypothetical protein